MRMDETVEAVSVLWDYAAEKTGDEKKATWLLSHLGFDNPHMLVKYDINKCKELIDKFLTFRKIATGKPL